MIPESRIRAYAEKSWAQAPSFELPLPALEGAAVLDLAGGPGVYTRALLKAGAARVVWHDASETLRAIAAEKLGANARAGDSLGANARAEDLLSANTRAEDLLGANARAGDSLGANARAEDLLGANARAEDLLGANARAEDLLGANARAEEGPGEYGGRVEFYVGDMADLSVYPSGSFDGVFFRDALHHALDERAVLAEIARVLKPGGWLYLFFATVHRLRSEPKRLSLLAQLPTAIAGWAVDWKPRTTLFTSRRIVRKRLDACGLVIEAERPAGHYHALIARKSGR